MKSAYKKNEMGEVEEMFKSLSDFNKKKIQKFLDLKKGSVTEGHLTHLKTSLIKFADLIELDLDLKIPRTEMKKANNLMLESVKNKVMSPRTIQDDVSAIKEFYKEIYDDGEDYPKIVKCLKRPKSRGNLKMPSQVLTEKQVYQMIRACNNTRDRCYIAVVGLDIASRVCESLNIRLGDIKRDKHGYFIIIHTAKESGDEETRNLRIIKSEPYLVKWLNEYPSEKTDDSYLFINYSNHKQLTKEGVDFIFKYLKRKLGFKKLYPKLLRHSLLTRMAESPNVSQSVLAKFSGHTSTSRVLAEYIHHGNRAVKEMQEKYNGKEKKKIIEKPVEPITCPKCKKSNAFDNEVCDYCSMALNQKRQVESFEKAKEFETYLPILEQLKKALEEQKQSKKKDVFKVMELKA